MKKVANNKKKNTKTRVKLKLRLLLFTLLFGVSVSILGYNCIVNLLKLKELNDQKVELQEQIVSLVDQKESLEADVERLSDKTYIARYAREKYLYSKEGELIIRIDDDE